MNGLINLGAHKGLKEFQVSLVKNSNLFSVVLFVFSIVYSLIFLFYLPENIGIALLFFIPSLVTLLLNYFKLTSVSRLVFPVLTAIAIAINYIYQITAIAGPIFLFMLLNVFILLWLLVDSREKLLWILSLIALFVIFFSGFSLKESLNIVGRMDVLNSFLAVSLMYGFNAIIMLGSLYRLQKKHLNSEAALKIVQSNLEEKSLEVEEKEKELENTLKEISESHKEDEKRNWISNGLAKINNILRAGGDNIYSKVLLGIIDYAKLLYGGIYQIEKSESEDEYILLLASYGFDKGKSDKKRFSTEEGILGSVYHEKKATYMIEIPKEFSKIESGLGEASPRSIIVAPMIYEDEVKGILELASFKTMQEHEREFITRVASILGRFIESFQSDEQTKLLLEKTQQQTEEMRAQEEEMRQNMEELQATQEELHRKEVEYLQKIKNLEEQLNK